MEDFYSESYYDLDGYSYANHLESSELALEFHLGVKLWDNPEELSQEDEWMS